MSSSSAIPQISSEEIATQDYLRALANFNAVLRADPICRQLMADKRAWGDIMYEEDKRAPRSTLFDKIVAQQAAVPPPVVVEYRSFPAPSARPPQTKPQPQPQRAQPQQTKPQPQQTKPQQKKRARNTFAALDDESDEENIQEIKNAAASWHAWQAGEIDDDGNEIE